jgi:hypothetical protein
MFLPDVIDANNLVPFIQLQHNTISRTKFGDPVNCRGLNGKAAGCPFFRFHRQHILSRLTNRADHISMTLR